MITTKLQVILLVSSFLFLFIVINLIRKESLELKYSLTWLISGFSFLVLPLFPNILIYVSSMFGIVNPVNTLFLIGNIFLISIVFSFTVALSRNSARVRNLTQEVAFLRLEMDDLIKNLGKKHD